MLIGNSAKTVVSVKNRGAGVLVAGRYRLERTIGSGGMGTVWLAHDLSLDAKCAVKLIDEEMAANAEIRVRFEREAKASAKLRSAHVVDVIDFGEWDGMCFIAMEYLKGEDLSSRLRRVGRLDPETTYRIVAHVARALVHAHAQGIIHRDLKPENIFLVQGYDEEVAKVLDFGIARSDAYDLEDKATREGAFLGTPCYVSPEQARGKTIDHRSDLWSLGVIAFECLTGRLPFSSEALGELMALILYEPIPKLTSLNPELPSSIDAWWERATERDPERRFQSAKEMADELGEVLGVPSVVGVPTGRSKVRGSYPSINDQSGVVYAPALKQTGSTRNPHPHTTLSSVVQSAPPTTRIFRVPFALSAVALLLSIGAIFGVWFKGKPVAASPAADPPATSRDMPQPQTSGLASPPAVQSTPPMAVDPIPPVPPSPPASAAGSDPKRGVKPANHSGSRKRPAPVPRRAAKPDPETQRERDYGI